MDKKSKVPKKQSKMLKNIGFVLILMMIGVTVYAYFNVPSGLQDISISEARSKTNNGEVSAITQKGNELEITLKDQTTPTLKSVKDSSGTLQDQGFEDGDWKLTIIQESKGGSLWMQLLIGLLPVGIIIGFFYFMMRQAQGQGNQAMNFGKSRAKLFGGDKESAKFKDIAGNGEAKQDLEEVVEFLKYPKKFQSLGAKIPKGVLLVGPPGTGKTMLARSVAGEAGVPFFSISGSEFVEMFVGVGASRVRDLFAKAKKNEPCIIFVDEIDAVGRRRGSGMGGGHDEREQTLNQILVEMDGFEQGTNVIVLAATNRADVLDPALLRPGRFDRRVNIVLPDRKDRLEILKVHFKKKPIESGVDLSALAAKTAGTSGADLANIANESAIIAARSNRKTINNDDVTEAFEKVAIGPERKNKIMTEKEKELTAYHEAGHALVGNVLPNSDDTHKVTIIPRGGTGGVTWSIPEEDKSYHSIIDYKDILARMLGGRVAEKLINGSEWVTTGAGSDLRNAHALAREMIVEQGMGKNLRDQVFHQDEGGMMFDRMVHDRPYSEETAKQIDTEVEALIKEAANRAELVISANMPQLEKLKVALLKKETLDGKEVKAAVKGYKLPAKARLY